MNKTVRRTLDLGKPSKPTRRQKAEIAALSKMAAAPIDYSDIPPLDAGFWKHAVQNPFYKPKKTSTTVRVDADVLLWLKTQGEGYQTRLNAILRSAMLAALQRR